jgi:hypothetical protein
VSIQTDEPIGRDNRRNQCEEQNRSEGDEAEHVAGMPVAGGRHDRIRPVDPRRGHGSVDHKGIGHLRLSVSWLALQPSTNRLVQQPSGGMAGH